MSNLLDHDVRRSSFGRSNNNMRNNRCCNDDQTQDFPILPDIKARVTLEIKDWMKVLMVGKKNILKNHFQCNPSHERFPQDWSCMLGVSWFRGSEDCSSNCSFFIKLTNSCRTPSHRWFLFRLVVSGELMALTG